MTAFSEVKTLFRNCLSAEDRHKVLIELGRSLPPMPEPFTTDENLVRGCQSIVYLHSEAREGKIYFTAFSDALISAGLAALLIKAYSGLKPEAVIKTKPTFLEELDLLTSLTPGRSNGLASMYTRMQKEALKILLPF